MHVCTNNEKFITANTIKRRRWRIFIWRVIIGFNFIHSVSQQCVTVCSNSLSQCVTVCPNSESLQCVPTVYHSMFQQCVPTVCQVCPNSVSSVSQVPTNIGIRRRLEDRLWFPIKGKKQVVDWNNSKSCQIFGQLILSISFW